MRSNPELVINLAEPHLTEAIEWIAPTTGSDPVPVDNQLLYLYERDKWKLGGFSRLESELVASRA